jgi:hypothetical protein
VSAPILKQDEGSHEARPLHNFIYFFSLFSQVNLLDLTIPPLTTLLISSIIRVWFREGSDGWERITRFSRRAVWNAVH